MMICTFSIGDGERYAMDAGELISLTPMPSEISSTGLITLRDEVMPIINPTEFIEGEIRPIEFFKLILVCAWEGSENKYAIAVDDVDDVVELQPDAIKPNPVVKESFTNLIDGVIIDDGKLVVLLNIQSLVQTALPTDECEIDLF